MAKIVFIIEDKEGDEGIFIKMTSNIPLPESYEQYTAAQILSGQIYEVCNRLLNVELD